METKFETHDIPDRETTEYTEILVECMELRLTLLRSLQALDRSNVDVSGGTNIDVTLGKLSRKQSLLDELATLGLRLDPFVQDDPETRVWKSPERRAWCASIAEKGNSILQQVIVRDQAAIEEMAQQRDAVAAQLQEGTDSILAHTAYTAGIAVSDTALDITDA